MTDVESLPRVDLDFDTPEHVDWPACTEYPPPWGIHWDYELARNGPPEGRS